MDKSGAANSREKLTPFYKNLLKQIDKSMQPQFDRCARAFNFAVEKVEKKLAHCEKKMFEYMDFVKGTAASDCFLAEALVNKELRFKSIMAQWTNRFLAQSNSKQLDALTWAFARFSLNVCLCYNEIPARAFMSASVHKALAGYIKFKSELVIGPALMALVHISLLPEFKPAIVLADVLPTIIKLLVASESKTILCQACKLLASLALHFPNKWMISNSGNLHGLLDLILGNEKEIDEHITYAALCGTVNTISGSDANRMLIVNLNGIKPLLSTIQYSSHDHHILQAIKALGNICYCNAFTAGSVLSQGGDLALINVLNAGDILKQPQLAHASMATLANICFSEATQSHIGSSPGLADVALRICKHAKEPYVVAEAAMLMLAMMWKNTGNKARLAGLGAIVILTARINKHAPLHDDDNLTCIEALCAALSTMLLHTANQERLLVIGGLEDMIKICKQYAVQRLIAAVSQVIVTLVPGPDEILRFHTDEYPIPVENVSALPVLKKAKFTGFGHLPSPPEWLNKAVQYLSMTDEGLSHQAPWVKTEFVDKLVFCKEFTTEILPDVAVMSSKSFRGLIFSVY